ncbi:MAG TPA: Do family serine endopeptidase [Planctomycetota bacterium]|nr:Do family serine endopeptidase [Planctomycetota bacterium]
MWRNRSGALLALLMGVVVGLGISVSLDWVQSLPAAPKLNDEEVNKELDALERQSQALAALAARVKPSVVTVYTMKVVRMSEHPEFDPFRFLLPDSPRDLRQSPREFRRPGQGSGVIVRADGRTGVVLTNFHVASGQDELKVKLSDGREFDAKLRGSDPKTDIAALEISGPNLPVAKLGNSEIVQPGEMCLAIGSPFGLEQTVTIGHVSAKGRRGFRRDTYENYIQVDAAINPGNSGGPLINLKGEVIGINTMIVTPSGVFSGVGLSIPINMAKVVMEELLEKGKVTRAWLGIVFSPLDKEVAEALKLDHGVQVNQIVPGDPADKAGIKEGDILLEFDGQKIADGEKFREIVAKAKVGTTVPVKVLRGKETLNLKVTLTEQPEDTATVRSRGALNRTLGLTVQDLTPELAEELGHKGEKGVVVTQVDAAGPAAAARPTPVAEGDLIQEVAQQPTDSVVAFNRALAKADLSKSILLLIRKRDGSKHFVVVKPRR